MDLEQLVCERLQLVCEEIWSDEDLNAVIRKYIALGEPVFASLRMQLDESRFGTTVMRRNAAADARDRYVAVIDCRGSKAARRFFTRWHEIAHLLADPTHPTSWVHRTAAETSPIERLMDEIAAEIGFYDPIFRPVLLEHHQLTFTAVETVRNRFCPHASFQATLIACTTHMPRPAIYLEAGMGYKTQEEAELHSGQTALFPMELPKAKLRALVVAANSAARAHGVRIDRNMEIPAESVIATLFYETFNTSTSLEGRARESLQMWQHSDGGSLGGVEVDIAARRLGERVFALILPILFP
jgi:hypothetical protein